MKTIPFEATSAPQREEAAAILVAASAHVPSAWHDMESARSEFSTFEARDVRSPVILAEIASSVSLGSMVEE